MNVWMMRFIMKRTVSLILLASMMAGLISCGGKTPASDTTVPTQTDSASDTAAVIEYPDLEWLESLPNCRRVDIIQTYLKARPGMTARVRQRGRDGHYVYFQTTKLHLKNKSHSFWHIYQ